jgi:hypothetical protein
VTSWSPCSASTMVAPTCPAPRRTIFMAERSLMLG